jgi:hypothetical protein
MAIVQISGRNRLPGSVVLASQTQEWLMERFAYAPQVRLVFGEQSPQSIGPTGNFVDL